jgi:hypothetical protein
LGYGREIDSEDALKVLERMASDEGLVGIAARFAKARVHLAWDGSPLRRRPSDAK